jgi:hypothetical protein
MENQIKNTARIPPAITELRGTSSLSFTKRNKGLINLTFVDSDLH